MTSGIRRAPGRMAALGCAALVAATVSGCGSVQNAVSGGSTSSAITMGTISTTSTLDPAGAYDTGSWMILENTFQSLLSFPVGATSPQPEAAQSCSFTGSDSMTYQCTLRSGLTFSNGHPLTAQDVVFSINRVKQINDPNGPSALFGTIQSVEAQGDSTVVFHLTQPDAVLPDELATAAGSIVDHTVFPANKELPNSQLIGSGPYKIESIQDMSDGKTPSQVVLTPNTHYQGSQKLANSKFTLRFYKTASEVKSALDSGAIDLTDNSLDPSVSAQLQTDSQSGVGNYKVTQGAASDASYLVFNTKDETTGQTAVRQAVAQLIDREAIAKDVYANTVEPLYSIIPQGIGGHTTAFFDKYGDPSVSKAKAILTAAKVPLPVKLDIAYQGGPVGQALTAQMKSELEADGLFQVNITTQSDPSAYQQGYTNGAYQSFLVGWSIDYPDAEDFVVPLVVGGGSFHNGYDNPQISQQLVPVSQKQADRTAAASTFASIQSILANDVPMLPLFQDKSYFVSRNNITGVEQTVDSTGVYRFAGIGRQ
ncbi:ABC transporter substrate-binding protein [Kitasatospora sp. NPDC052896]|uniref:ABC transporter substrate-binding protein n=1 Tax=Kitasatospora sp. NPDC052896 TaxID=3364061 RepID=UPI0037C90913